MIKTITTIVLCCFLAGFVFGQDEETNFSQVYRPQYHFTSPQNWIGSPSGVIYSEKDSLYHLFYEQSTVDVTPVYLNMGHAVSPDLVHWNCLPVALEPDDNTRDLYKCTIRAGSVLVDHQNRLGKQLGDQPSWLMFYTSVECGIRLAYSTDAGKNWVKYGGNPLIPFKADENARSPKVFWYDAGQCYVMVLARNPESSDIPEGISFYTSGNLIDWTYQSHYIGPKGSPDMFQLPVNNHLDETYWVVTDSLGSYMVGQFDGKRFKPETELLSGVSGTFRGAKTFAVADEKGTSRVLQLASIGDAQQPDMPFAGQLSIPVELKLRTYPEGIRLVKQPIEALEQLQRKVISITDKNIIPGLNKNPIKRIKGDCFRLKGTFGLKSVSSFGFVIRVGKTGEGTEIRYDATRQQLFCLGATASLPPEDGKIKLDIWVDRSSVEIFANDGKVVMSSVFTPVIDAEDCVLYNTGGELYIENLEIYPLESVYGEGKK
ncbi:glycoside hydrolase family 32 protein [Mangrovibacterium marinum]|uniref:Fructan beta-fructosidase n=1 Tax=Mangrovibacterium marinum TaxID=1639118 RepID=A0A2T5C2R9_9BACT|nr:glycoside hydrolase family 32 protein [Mangrovibacterium marinum]PTN08987.1 fructan beta-fructosidase [Mangrovibacterium marinum]